MFTENAICPCHCCKACFILYDDSQLMMLTQGTLQSTVLSCHKGFIISASGKCNLKNPKKDDLRGQTQKETASAMAPSSGLMYKVLRLMKKIAELIIS